MEATINREALLYQLLNFGEAMMACGAEISRVEDTLTRLGRAYGADKMHVFVITSSMVVTLEMPDGEVYTQSRRIHGAGSTNYARLEALNALSRRCCASPMTVEQFRKQLSSILQKPMDSWRVYVGSALAAGSFAVFFGGSLADGLVALLFGLLICFLQGLLAKACPNKVVYQLLCSLAAGFGICAVAQLIPGLHPDKIMIGDIMLLIPGIAMTNSVRDMLVGDTISGIMRLIESLLWAGALACGFMIAIWMIGG